MDTGLRQLRKIARLTQIELSQRTGIDRTRLSFLECGYLSLTKDEESLIRKAITEATESHAARVRDALAVTAEPAGVVAKGERLDSAGARFFYSYKKGETKVTRQ